MRKGSRSKTDLSNLQEVHESGGDVRKGLAQYYTPDSIGERIFNEIRESLDGQVPCSVIDPQAGGMGLLKHFGFPSIKYAVDIMPPEGTDEPRYLTADCRKFGEIADELYPDLVWECGVANYPFGLAWKGQKPWEWTWQFLQRHTAMGCMIGAENEVGHLANHYTVWKTETMQWPDANVEVRLLWYDTGRKATNEEEIASTWPVIEEIVRQEKNTIPEFNVWMRDTSAFAGRNGSLSVFLSVRDRTKLRISNATAKRLMSLDGMTPQVLAVDRETRVILNELVTAGIYKIEPKTEEIIREALREAERVATPIMPVTDFERVAYLDEEDTVLCLNSWGPFKKGEKYPVASRNYTFRQDFTRRKPHYNDQTDEMETVDHHCSLSGQDRKIVVEGYSFMANPTPGADKELPEDRLWEIFARPPVITVADKYPEKVAEVRRTLEAAEMICNFQFFPGQMEYLSRVLVRDSALIAAQTGTGKTLMAISSYMVKDAQRCLVVCPKGVAASDGDEMSQWISEIHEFAPHIEVFRLFTHADYLRITSLNGGELPPGFYVTYYDAFYKNGAIENCSMINPEEPRWNDTKLYDIVYPDMDDEERAEIAKKNSLVKTVGEEVDGIRCIAKPSLSTLIGHQFDMICLDEAHNIKSLSANVTKAAIRLSPKYRFAFTATPVPNTATDIFPVIGWVCVDEWYRGGISNAAFPFRREDLSRFESLFLSRERDYTAEAMLRSRDRTNRSRKVEKVSPVLSSPARLLKILKPAIAYITKPQCNPDYLPPRIVDVRVPLGADQSRLYAYFTHLGRITHTIAGTKITNTLVQYSAQIEWMRTICTDPVHASTRAPQEAPMVGESFNPKVAAILELTAAAMRNGEQVVIVNARKGITDVLHNRLEEAGVPVSRIDSSDRSGNHAEESNLFKRGFTKVMLMGIKCAVGHSYAQCKNLIIGSLEYSAGPFEQAQGRVDRLTSKESRIYCILHRNTIEEVMFDTVAMKDDASKIILRGQRVPRDFVPVDMSEVLMDSIIAWNSRDNTTVPESECAAQWDAIKDALK